MGCILFISAEVKGTSLVYSEPGCFNANEFETYKSTESSHFQYTVLGVRSVYVELFLDATCRNTIYYSNMIYWGLICHSNHGFLTHYSGILLVIKDKLRD